MVSDRKEFIEQEIKRLNNEVVNTFLSITIGNDVGLSDPSFERLNKQIAELRTELKNMKQADVA